MAHAVRRAALWRMMCRWSFAWLRKPQATRLICLITLLWPSVRALDAEFEEALDLGPPPLDRGRQPGRLDGVGDGADGEEAGQPVGGLVSAAARRAVARRMGTRQYDKPPCCAGQRQ